MNISISNLAWDLKDLDQCLIALKKHNIHHIEGIFTKIKDWDNIKHIDIISYANKFKENNVSISSFQSIFYQTKILDFKNYKETAAHLSNVIEMASISNAKILVLGSPKLRKQGSLKELKKSLDLVDNLLEEKNIFLCIEPNCKLYGGSYFYSLKEICSFIETNKYKKIKSMIDTYNLLQEGFNLIEEYKLYNDYIYHIHFSEESLNEIINPKKYIDFISEIKYSYDRLVVYEFKHFNNFDNAIKTFSNLFM